MSETSHYEQAQESNVPVENQQGELHSEDEAEHEITLIAEPIIEVGPLVVTNSLLSSWIVVLLLVIAAFVIRKKIKKIPRGLQNIIEIVLEGALNLADSITNDRKKTDILFPVAIIFFSFILFNNWFGLLPGIGTIGFLEHGTFIPLLRGGTADLNATLAWALCGVIFTHLAAIISIGIWKHFNKFIGVKLFLDIPKKMFKDPTIIIVNPVKAFIGFIEIISEISKVASLSLRLFGNIFAGEVLLVSLAAIFAFVAPIPFIFLELIVGLIQALIFSMLIVVFGTIALADDH